MSFFQIDRCKTPRKRKLLEKSLEQIDKELDLQRFIRNMRLQLTANIALLTPNQRLFAEKISQVVVPESSADSDILGVDSNDSAQDDPIMQETMKRTTKSMVRSREKSD